VSKGNPTGFLDGGDELIVDQMGHEEAEEDVDDDWG